MQWAHGRGMDLTLIEVMPLGDVGEGRLDQYLPLSIVRARLAERLHAGRHRLSHRRPGALSCALRKPAAGSVSSRPSRTISANPAIACGSPAPGTLYMCLGQEDAADLRTPLRASEGNELARCGDHGSDHAQAQGSRFHHRPPASAPRTLPPHERHGRLTTLHGNSEFP